MDFDGKPDVTLFFEKDQLVRKEYAFGFDGVPHSFNYYEKNKLVRKERDTNGDGKVDTWEYWENGEVDRVGVDLDGDGQVDRWETRKTAQVPAAAAGREEEHVTGSSRGRRPPRGSSGRPEVQRQPTDTDSESSRRAKSSTPARAAPWGRRPAQPPGARAPASTPSSGRQRPTSGPQRRPSAGVTASAPRPSGRSADPKPSRASASRSPSSQQEVTAARRAAAPPGAPETAVSKENPTGGGSAAAPEGTASSRTSERDAERIRMWHGQEQGPCSPCAPASPPASPWPPASPGGDRPAPRRRLPRPHRWSTPAPPRSCAAGYAHLEAGDAERAEVAFEHALEFAPDLPEGWNGLGVVARGRDEPPRRTPAVRPRRPARPRLRRGARQPRRGAAHAGAARRRRSRSCAPRCGSTPTWPRPGRTWRAPCSARGWPIRPGREARWLEARREYLHLLEAVPDSPAAHADLAFMDYLSGRFATAERGYRRAAELAPSPERLLGLCLSLVRLGRCGEAVAACERCLDIFPANQACLASRQAAEACGDGGGF